MKMIRIMVAVFGLGAVALSGCSNKKAVKLAEDMADAVCACKDMKCVADEGTKFAEKAKDLGENPQGTEGDAKASRRLPSAPKSV